MTDGTEGFALGSGRARPAYKPKPITCAQCGASIVLKDERAQVIVCQYCHTQIELTATQATAIGVVSGAEPNFELPIGAVFDWAGVRYEVVGRIARENPEDLEDARNHDFLLYNPRHPCLWLSSYEREWWIAGRTRVLPVGEAIRAGAELATHDGRRWRTVEREVSRIAYVDGALPWLARVGDTMRHAAFVAADGSGETYEAEYSERGEIEFSRGVRLSEAQVRQASSGRLKPRAVAVLAEAGERPRMRAIAIITLGFGVLSLVTGLVFSVVGTRLANATLPAEGGRVGPVVVERANTVLDVEVYQPFRADGWSYVEAEVQDEEGEYLFGFGEELWAESGYDGGSWHEEKNDYDLNVTIPEPGTYYLAFTAQAAGVQYGGYSPAIETRVTVEKKIGSSLPFLVAGILALLGGAFLFFASSSKLRQTITERGINMLESS